MNPIDFMLPLVCVAVAVMSVSFHCWTLNGIAPAILSTAGGFWQLWMQWLRHKSWLQHRNSGFVPGTQHLALSAAVGWFIGLSSGIIRLLVAADG
jgi:hypothetical protein